MQGVPLGNYRLGDYFPSKVYIGNFMFINMVVKSLIVDNTVDFY